MRTTWIFGAEEFKVNQVYHKIKIVIKKLIDIVLFGNIKKRRSADYWSRLYSKAKGSSRGVRLYLLKRRYQKIVNECNAFIPLQVSFAERPTMPHGISGVFISSGARIGQNCTIFHQVTIGSNTLADSPGCGAPTIGDNVYIGCGAKIIGNVHVGDNVRIGANCVVTVDIPSNCTVVLEKPRIILKENNTNVFTTYENMCNENSKSDVVNV